MAADADFAGVEPASINPLETSVTDDGGGSPNVRRGALRLVEAITRQLADWPMVVVHGVEVAARCDLAGYWPPHPSNIR
jgi:hypothetical protein